MWHGPIKSVLTCFFTLAVALIGCGRTSSDDDPSGDQDDSSVKEALGTERDNDEQSKTTSNESQLKPPVQVIAPAKSDLSTDELLVRAYQASLFKPQCPRRIEGEPPKLAVARNTLYIEGEQSVWSMDFSRDGRLLVSGHADGTIQFWPGLATSPRSGDDSQSPLRILSGHTDAVPAIALSPDDKYMVSGGLDHVIKLWDVQSAKVVRQFESLPGLVDQVAFSPDGQLLLAASSGRDRLAVYSVDHDSPLWKSANHSIGEFAPDSKSIAVAGHGTPLEILQARSGKLVRLIESKQKTTALAFSPDGSTLVASSVDPTRTVFYTPEGQVVREIDDHYFSHVCYLPEGKIICGATGGAYKTVQFWDAGSFELIRQVAQRQGAPAVSRDGHLLAAESATRITVWDIPLLLDFPAGHFLERFDQSGYSKIEGDLLILRAGSGHSDEDLEGCEAVSVPFGFDFSSTNITDEGFARLSANPHLVELDASYLDEISHDGLKHIGELSNLRSLHLRNLKSVTDEGLSRLSQLTKLKSLDLQGTSTSGTGLHELRELTGLNELVLSGHTTEEGLSLLIPFSNLVELRVYSDSITDAGMAYLTQMKKLRRLSYCGELVSGMGLEHLASMQKLEELSFKSSGITDDGLAQLPVLASLRNLDLSWNQGISDEVLQNLARVSNLERLNLNGCGGIRGPGLLHLEQLTQLETIELGYCEELKGSGLAVFSKLPNVTRLDLYRTAVMDEDLEHVARAKQLEYLKIPEHISDSGILHLVGLPNLKDLEFTKLPEVRGIGLASVAKAGKFRELDLKQTGVSDEGLSHFADLVELRSLRLPRRITDAGLAHLKGLTNLENLDLNDTKITNDGLKHLSSLGNLQWLGVQDTRLTDEGLVHLRENSRLSAVSHLDSSLSESEVEDLVRQKGKYGLENRSLNVANETIEAVALSPNGNTLAIGTESGELKLVAVDTGKTRFTVEDGYSTGADLGFVFLEDGQSFLCCADYQNIDRRETTSGKVIDTYRVEGEVVTFNHMAVGNEDGLLITCSQDTLVTCPLMGERSWKRMQQREHIVAFDVDVSGRFAALGFKSGGVSVWDLIQGKRVANYNRHGTRRIDGLAISRDGQLVASVDEYDRLLVCNGNDGTILWQIERQYAYELAFSPDGTQLVIGSLCDDAQIFDAQSGGHLRTYKCSLTAMAISRDGKTLVAGGLNGVLKSWDMPPIKTNHD